MKLSESSLSEAVNSTTKFYFEDFRKSNPTLFWIFTVLLIGIVAIIITLIVLFVIFIFTKIFGKGKEEEKITSDLGANINKLKQKKSHNEYIRDILKGYLDDESISYPLLINIKEKSYRFANKDALFNDYKMYNEKANQLTIKIKLLTSQEFTI